jgi:predicted transcriptional regulator
MAHTYTKRIQKVQDLLEDHLDKRKSEDIEEEFEAQNMQSLLEKQAKLNKEAREFVKEVSALRAPKVMVAQFLESFIDDTIKEVSVLLGNLAEGLHHDLNEELTEAGYNTLDSEMYKKVFRNLALEYRDRMINLKRQHMSSALSALQDLEKII